MQKNTECANYSKNRRAQLNFAFYILLSRSLCSSALSRFRALVVFIENPKLKIKVCFSTFFPCAFSACHFYHESLAETQYVYFFRVSPFSHFCSESPNETQNKHRFVIDKVTKMTSKMRPKSDNHKLSKVC